jgi:hypothetical protein
VIGRQFLLRSLPISARHEMMMAYSVFSLFVCLFVAAFAWAQPQLDERISFPPDARFIFPITVGPDLLEQCSRSTPTNVSGFWEPTMAQIEELETHLVAYLAARAKSGEAMPPGIAYHRQYVGIISDGARRIYGNFYPGRKSSRATIPVIICDGGPVFWGIEYDIETKTFMKPNFNGPASIRALQPLAASSPK